MELHIFTILCEMLFGTNSRNFGTVTVHCGHFQSLGISFSARFSNISILKYLFSCRSSKTRFEYQKLHLGALKKYAKNLS